MTSVSGTAAFAAGAPMSAPHTSPQMPKPPLNERLISAPLNSITRFRHHTSPPPTESGHGAAPLASADGDHQPMHHGPRLGGARAGRSRSGGDRRRLSRTGCP